MLRRGVVVVVVLAVVQDRPLEVGDVALDREQRLAGSQVDGVRNGCDGSGHVTRRIRRIKGGLVVFFTLCIKTVPQILRCFGQIEAGDLLFNQTFTQPCPGP